MPGTAEEFLAKHGGAVGAPAEAPKTADDFLAKYGAPSAEGVKVDPEPLSQEFKDRYVAEKEAVDVASGLTKKQYPGGYPHGASAARALVNRVADDEKKVADEVGPWITAGRALTGASPIPFNMEDEETRRLGDIYASERPVARIATGVGQGIGFAAPAGLVGRGLRAVGVGRMTSGIASGGIVGAAQTPGGLKERVEGGLGAAAMMGVAGPVSRAVGGANPGLVRNLASGAAGFAAGGYAIDRDAERLPEHAITGAIFHAPGAIGKMASRPKPSGVELVDVAELPGEKPAPKTYSESATAADTVNVEMRQRIPAAVEKPRVQIRADVSEPVASPAPAPRGSVGPLTSIKNRVVNEERAARGVEPMPEPTRRPHEVANADAAKIVEANPERPRELAREVANEPRPLTDTDVMLLDRRRVDLHKARKAADADVIAAAEKGDLDAVAKARARVDQLGDEFLVLEQASKAGGTESARGLAARVRMMAEDFSLPAMETRRRVANEGKRLTPKQAVETKALHEQLTKAVAERDAYQTRLREVEAQRGVVQAMRASRAAPPLRTSPEYGATNRIVNRAAYDQAKANLRAKLTQMNVGIDPAMLADLVKIGTFHVEAGARKFGKWAKAMSEELGDKYDKFAPHLKSVFDESLRSLSTKTVADVAEKVRAGIAEGKAIDQMPADVGRIAEMVMRTGVKDRTALIDEVHSILSSVDPRITKRETMDAISGYGKTKQTSADPIKAELRELKGQMQQLAKLEDMASGKAPLKSGLQRQEPGDAQRELIRQVNEAKKKGGFETPDPEHQLKSALASLKTRMKNRIVELERQVKTGDFRKPERNTIAKDAEAVRLEANLDVAKKAWHEAIARDRLKNRPLTRKVFDNAVRDPIDLSRAIMTGLDVSAVGRQGLIAALARPGHAARAVVPMLRSIRSADGQARVEAKIKLNENYNVARKAGVRFSEHNTHDVTAMEEAMRSRLAAKIPGLAGLQRGFTTYLNHLRMDLFNTFERSLSRTGKATHEEAQNIAQLVNVMTGRGGPLKHGHAAAAMDYATTLLFSPRLLASRLQWLTGQPLVGGSGRTRKLVAKEYGRFLAGVVAIYGVAALFDADLEGNPLSSDFGKVKFGNTRLDPMGGLLQVFTHASRLITGYSKSTTNGEIYPLRGEGSKRGAMWETMADFWRKKFAPIPGALVSGIAGEDPIHRKTTWGKEALGLVTPMSVGGEDVWFDGGDIYKAMREHGVPQGAAMWMMSLLGVGLQHHDERAKASRR